MHPAEQSTSVYLPPGQGRQPVLPVAFWKKTHALLPGSACFEPAAHGRGATEPEEHALPGGHSEHWDGRERSVALEYLRHERALLRSLAMQS